jgi:glycosyltransferase involved in cell wall biosynthesis
MARALKIWIPAVRVGSGADVFVQRLAEGLSKAGHEPLVQWFPHGYELLPELMRRHVPVKDIDIIHSNSWGASAFIGASVPLVTTVLHLVHDPFYAPYRSRAQAIYHRFHVRWREAAGIKASAAVTAISDYVAGTVRTVFGRQDVHAISNWVDLNKYRPADKDEPHGSRPFRLFMVGNQTKRKGADLFEDFVAQLGPAFELSFTGGLRATMVRAGSTNVRFLGRIAEEQLVEEYQRCDAVVSLSRYEGFGYSALEGMACGKPFIGFNTSGLADVVANNRTGLLVPVNDLTALLDACRQMAHDQRIYQAMSQAARNRAVDVFREDEAIAKYVSIYQDVLR